MNFKYLIILPVLILNLGLIQAEDSDDDFEKISFKKGFDLGIEKGVDLGFKIGNELGEQVGFEEGISVTICAAAAGFGLYKTGKNLFGYALNPLKYKSDLVTSRLVSIVPVWRLSSKDAKLKLADLGRLVAPANTVGSEAYIRACDYAEAKSLSDSTKFDLAETYAQQCQKECEELR
jgi:hypothetical protein